MRLIVTQNASMIADVACEREAVYIGSGNDCAVHLDDPRIPPQHAIVAPEDDAWTIRVLDSETVVQVNGTRISEHVSLKTGDEIKICDFVIRVFPEQDASATAAAQQPGRSTAVARLNQFVQSQLPAGSVIKRTDEATTLVPGQLKKMGEISFRLCQAATVENLIDAALQVLLETFAAQRVWIGIRRVNYGPMEWVEGRLVTGQTTELPDFGENVKPRVLDRGQTLLVPRISTDHRIAVLAGPLNGPEGPLGMAYVDSGEKGRRFDSHDLDFFTLTTTLIGAQLDAILKQIAKNRAAQIAGEVSVAHAIQARITPRKLPQWPELGFGAFREPGSERTGDFYDVVKLGNGMAYFLLAHTHATGPFPSMLMSQTQSAFRFAAMHQDQPQILLQSLSWLLYDGQQDHPLDCFVGVIDPSNGQMRYSMAGHLGAYIIGQRGDERKLEANPPTPPLGTVRNAEYALLPEKLDNGETVALFTPGVVTAKNRQGETFGEDRFINILCDGFGQLASAMLKEMFNDLGAFTEGGTQPDDITVVLAHRV